MRTQIMHNSAQGIAKYKQRLVGDAASFPVPNPRPAPLFLPLLVPLLVPRLQPGNAIVFEAPASYAPATQDAFKINRLGTLNQELRGRLKSPSGACADRCKLPKIRSASLQLESVRRQAGGLRYFKSDFLDALLAPFKPPIDLPACKNPSLLLHESASSPRTMVRNETAKPSHHTNPRYA